VVASQIANDAHWAQVIFAAKVEDFLFNLDQRPIGMPLRDRWSIYEPSFTMFFVCGAPSIEGTLANAKVPAGS